MVNNIGVFHRRINCRVCKSENVTVFLDYGEVPLAGNFVLPSELDEVKLYPMDLAVCPDCSLVQILNVVDPEVIFTDYRYLSSVTRTLTRHFREYAALLQQEILPPTDPFLVEIGCNDGVLLDPLQKLGVRVLGVDAADNVIQLTRQRGIDVIHGFFGLSIADAIEKKHGKADVITASNVFAHIDDLDGVMQGVDRLLSVEGKFIVEVHYVLDLLKLFQFDTVYHEHLCYYSLHALQVLYRRFGFSIVDVHHLPMHGGAIRVFAQRSESVHGNIKPVVQKMLEEELRHGIDKTQTYKEFGLQVERYRDNLAAFLLSRNKSNRTLSAYGAAGRATILLNYCKLDQSKVEYIVDESSFRVGRCVPGVGIPIVSRSVLAEKPTDDCLITAWNYRDEIVGKEPAYLNQGGCFIMPLPHIEIIQSPTFGIQS
ncbi:MAG: class I SAM-dependent methyltransferase [candidate division Zixibacteria bacterium]|nr:class I SAM-dependent methyltransferase [candidate division Zixibacteria bacterium]